MQNQNFIKRLGVDVPLIMGNHLSAMLASQRDNVSAAEAEIFKRIRGGLEPKVEQVHGGIAVVPVQGTLAYNPDLMEMIYDGVEDSRSVLKMINQVSQDDGVKGVLLRMDTPGGMFLGGPEISDAVKYMRAKKPVVAHAAGLCASLGYMIASQANLIVANPSAVVGSIGVIASVTDYTALLEKLGIKFEYFTNAEAKFKGAGAIGTSLTDDQRTQLQSQVDGCFRVFRATVLSARPQVVAAAMQGQTFRGSEAKGMGLVDRIGDEGFALSVLKSLIK